MKVYDGRDDKKLVPTTHTISVVSSNTVVCTESDLMTIRKNGREDWSLYYCEAGCIHLSDTDFKSGQVYIYPPKVPQKYIIYKKDNTLYHYLHFTGTDVEKLFNDLSIKTLTAIDVNKKFFKEKFEIIEKSLESNDPLSQVISEYHTLHLISKLAHKSHGNYEINMMRRIIDRMEHSLSEEYNADNYAKMLHISVSRFNHLFKEQMGISPYSYYMNLRIINASTLLESTDLQIKDIAQMCGYQDPMYFTQAFKKAVGITPSKFRKKSKI